MSSSNLTNGESAAKSSKFISHITSYPVVSDSVEAVKSHPYGKKSLDLADSAYQRFAKPVEPYLETPYNYAKPYVAKADELADSGLGHVDSRFPIVKEETGTLVEKGKSVVFWPITVAASGRDYVIGTYNDEYKKTSQHKDRGTGIQTMIMALLSTELKVASDFFQMVADFLGPKYEEGKAKGADYVKQAQDVGEQYKGLAQDKLADLQKTGEEKAGEAKSQAQKTKGEAEKKVQK